MTRGARRSPSLPLVAVLACAAALLASAAARAQPARQGEAKERADATGDNGAIGEALFRDGRALMVAGNLEAACPKFAESQRIDPKIGTLMNLALCHEKAGRTASAWAEYTQAATLAWRAGQADRERVATSHAKQLEPALAHVVIDAEPKSGDVVLDDQPVGPAVYRTPIPVDPGPHVLRASAAGMAPFERSFQIATGTSLTSLTVPALEPAPASPAAPAPDAPAPSRRRTLGLVVGGAGVVLAGVGAYFGVRAFSDKSSAENGCGATFCTAAGQSAKSAMKTDETLSTIGVLAGVAAAGVGLTLVLWNRGDKPGAVSVEVAPRGVQARVSW